MITDALLNLVAPGSPLSLVGSVAVASNIIDILGNGVGQAPTSIFGTATLFGEDTGVGTYDPEIQINAGVAIAGTTLNIAWQGAPDTGVAGLYLPGTWQTFAESGPITVAQFTSAISRGVPVWRDDLAVSFPDNYNPRYLRLLFSPAAGGTWTAGTIASAFITLMRDDLSLRYQPRNYTVGNIS